MKMGNRAVVSVEGGEVGIYLHWNGGIESVNAFLRAAKDLGVRDPVEDQSYFLARFAQIIGNFHGGTTSVGVGPLKRLDTDNGDNGHFIVGAGFKIVGRKHACGNLQSDQGYEDKVYEVAMRVNRPIFEREG
jgi:hypothetical protein